jgi:hypothetical protein
MFMLRGIAYLGYWKQCFDMTFGFIQIVNVGATCWMHSMRREVGTARHIIMKARDSPWGLQVSNYEPI